MAKPVEANGHRLADEIREKYYEEFSQAVLESYFDHYGIVSQNIDSFNRFIEYSLPKIITSKPLVVTNTDGNVRYEIYVRKVDVAKPTSDDHEEENRVLSPNECRLRQMSYMSEILIWGYYRVLTKRGDEWEEVPPEKKGKDRHQEFKKMCIGRIPAMVRSVVCHLANMTEEDLLKAKECPLDPGGYFILKGKEKVLLSREKLPENQLMVFETLKQERWISQCEIRCRANEVSNMARATWVRYSSKTRRGVSINQDSDEDEDGEEDEDGDNESSWKSLNAITRAHLQKWFKELKNRKHFYVVSPRSTSTQIPLYVFMVALGVTSPDFVEDWIMQGETEETATKMKEMVEPTLEFWKQQEIDQVAAMRIIGFLSRTKKDSQPKTPYEWGRDFLNNILLPHIGTEPEDDLAKALFLAHMVRSICECSLNLRAYDDRDHLKNKRLDLPGSLCADLFSRSWKEIEDRMRKSLMKRTRMTKHLNPTKLISEFTVTQRFEYIIRTGNLGKNAGFGTGISQELSRTCRVATLSALRRVMTLSQSGSRNLTARYLHPTCFGMICPYESPEGPQIGLVKNLALSARVTVGCDPEVVEKALLSQETLTVLTHSEFQASQYPKGSVKIFLNGKWLGSLEPGVNYKSLKRNITSINGVKASEVSFEYIKKRIPELHIRCDAGRLIRPLFVCTDSRHTKINKMLKKGLRLRWPDLVSKGCVEELDTAELMDSYISTSTIGKITPEHTHKEIHPHMIMGLCASTIPFANHNQAARSCYQSNMAKQSIGMYSTSFQHRSDSLAHILAYSHKPLLSTLGANVTKLWEMPAGVECIVAIASWSGYNEEDSVIFSKSAIDRGLFRSFAVQSFSSIQADCGRFDTKIQVFTKPEGTEAPHMDDDGLPWSGEKVLPDEPIIGKNIVEAAKEPFNASVMLKTVGPVTVQRSYVAVREDGEGLHCVQVEEVRLPKIGDKFSSRHGQKGVIGMVFNQEDLPFNKHGMTPDIIINPHAIPSRMTIGHLIEAVAGKARCVRAGRGCIKSGKQGCICPKQPLFTGTTFSKCLTKESLESILDDNGYHRSGEEMFFDPYTGQKFQASVFTGVNYYQRLKHMVDDKFSVRREGAVDPLTGQPKKASARDAAQRLGEMERDCLIAHGASALFHERFFQKSDGTYLKICTQCGTVAAPVITVAVTTDEDTATKGTAPKYTCTPCMRRENPQIQLATIAMPKATKLLIQELTSMGIRVKLVTENFARPEA